MKTRTALITVLASFALAGCAFLGGLQSGYTDGPNQLQKVKVARTESGYRFYFKAQRAPTYTVFRMVDPIRLIVDVSELDVRKVKKTIPVNRDNIKSLRFRQFGGAMVKAGRIEIALSSFAEYQAKVYGNTLVIAVEKGVQLADTGKVIRVQAVEDDFEDLPDDLPEDEGFGDEEVVLEEDFGGDSFVEEAPAEEETASEEAPTEEEVVAEEAPAEEEAIAEEAPAEEEAVAEEAPAEEEAVAAEAPVEEEVVAEEAPAEEEAIDAEAPIEEEVAAEEAPVEEIEEAPVEDEAAVEEVPVEGEAVAEEAPGEDEAVAEEAPVMPEETPVVEAPVVGEVPSDEAVVEEIPSDETPVSEDVLTGDVEEDASDLSGAPAVESEVVEAPLEEIPLDDSEPNAGTADGEAVTGEDDLSDLESLEAAPAAVEPLSEEEQMANDVLNGSDEPMPAIENAETEPVVESESVPVAMPTADEATAGDGDEGIDEPVLESPAGEAGNVDMPVSQGMNVVELAATTGENETQIRISLDGPAGDYNVFTLENPNRLVIDLDQYQSRLGMKEYPVDSSNVKQIRVAEHADKVRLVVDIDGALPPYDVKKEENTLLVTVFAAGAEEPEPEIVVEETEPAPEISPVISAADMPDENIEESADLVDMSPEELQQAASEPEAELPKVKRRAVKGVSATIAISEKPAQKAKKAEAKKKYSGRRMSLDFKDADIKNVLRLIAEVSNLNIITDEDVTGLISIRLVNVPWDQALDVILQSKQLGLRRMGNIIRIGSSIKLSEEDQRKLQALNDKEKMEPLFIKVLPINYAKASEMSAQVKPLLSARGSVDTDARTNVVIVKDIQRNLVDIEALIKNLDTQTPQVLIEAKIVEANTNFTKELGIQWGGGFDGRNTLNQNLGIFFPNTLGASGASANPNQVAPEGDTPNFAVDLPAAVGAGSGGSIGFMFGTLNNSITLSLRLSALESSGEGRVISSPRITTMDNREAMIQQGISIPFETTSSQGTATQFIDASIKLTVTPHVNSDRSIVMEIQAEKNAPSTELRSASGAPSISKKEAKTQVLVYDGETTVIGGIFQLEKTRSQNGIPFLSKIPVLGWFFTKKSETEKRTELLIFITPRIVTRTARQTAF